MSYILDALRKADAQRERDPARGIHAQPVALPPSDSAARRKLWPVWIIGALALVAVGAAALWRSAAAPEGPGDAARVTVGAPVVGNPPSSVTAPPAPVVLPAPPPMPMPMPMERSAPPPAAAVAAVPTPPPAAPTQPAARAAQPAAMQAAPAVPAPADRVFTVAELPPELQRELPKLAISGGVYSDNPAQRMLIVGGQVVNEGAELAPGLRLEEIRPRAAVLKFRNYRYSVAY
jgi:general secretion pathway protein B